MDAGREKEKKFGPTKMGAPRHLSERLHHNDARYLRLSGSRRERQRSGFKPPRVPETEGEGEERWKATRKAKREAAERAQWRRGTGTGLHLSKAPYRLPVFRVTTYSPHERKQSQNRVMNPGQEKWMELEELELDQHQHPSSLVWTRLSR